MKRFKIARKYFAVPALAVVGFASNAMAAVDLTDVETGLTAGTTLVEGLAAAVLVGLAAMWVIRKLIKTSNRS